MKEVNKMKIYATEMKNGKILDKKIVGEVRLLKDGNGDYLPTGRYFRLISACRTNEEESEEVIFF